MLTLLKLQDNVKKASIICRQDDLASLGGCDGKTPEQISAEIESLNHTLRRESKRHGIRLLILIIILQHARRSFSFSHTHALYNHAH